MTTSMRLNVQHLNIPSLATLDAWVEKQIFALGRTRQIDEKLKVRKRLADLGVDKHYGYAFQWYALAAVILIFYLVHHVRKRA